VYLPAHQARQQQVARGKRLLDEPVFAVDVGVGHDAFYITTNLGS